MQKLSLVMLGLILAGTARAQNVGKNASFGNLLGSPSDNQALVSTLATKLSSATEVYISQIGCAQGADLATGFAYGTTTPATDAGPCITNYINTHVMPNGMLILHQDGASVVSGISGPTGGWGIVSDAKPSMRHVPISGCSISSNVITCTTTQPHGLVVGEGAILNGFPASTYLNYSVSGAPGVVVASVPSSTTFTAAYSHSNATIEAGVLQVITGNGFYAKTGTNGDVINNCSQIALCTSSSMNPGWSSPGPAPARSGGGLVFRNLFINGNRGNGSNGNSTNGNANGIGGFSNVYGNNYRTYADINIWNASGVEMSGNWLFNSPSYMANVNNVSNLAANGNVFDTTGPGVIPHEENGDGFHVNGPAENIHADGNLFRTGDDAWALNACEGYVGPINNVTITNSTYDHALSAGRIYTDSIAPPSGDAMPTVSNVLVNGGVGTVVYDVMEFGFEIQHTLTVGNTMWNMRTSNLNLTVSGGDGHQDGFRLSDSVVDLSFDHIAIAGVANGNLPLFNTFNNSGFASLSLNDISIYRSGAGSTTGGLLGGSAVAYGRLSINGVKIVDTDVSQSSATPYGVTPALITTASGTTINALFHAGVDMTNVSALLATPSAATIVQTDAATASGSVISSVNGPQFVGINPTAGTDLKRWDSLQSGSDGSLTVRAVNDANNQAAAAYTISRTVTNGLPVVTGFDFKVAPTVNGQSIGGGATASISGSNPAFSLTNTSPATGTSEQSYLGTYAGQATLSFNRVPTTGAVPNAGEPGVYATVGASGTSPFFDVSYQANGGNATTLFHVSPAGVTGPNGQPFGGSATPTFTTVTANTFITGTPVQAFLQYSPSLFLAANGGQTIQYNAANGADIKAWDAIVQNDGSLLYRAVNDANTQAQPWLTVTRGLNNGLPVISNVTFGGPVSSPNGYTGTCTSGVVVVGGIVTGCQ